MEILPQKSLTRPRNSYIWPAKHHTSISDWQLWRRWLKSLCRHNTLTLITPLEEWNCKREEWIQQWDCFITDNMELLYIHSPHGQGWTRHVLQPGRRWQSHRYFVEVLQCNGLVEPPEALERVTVHQHRHYIEIVAQAQHTRPWHAAHEVHQVVWNPFPAHRESLLNKITEVLQPVYLESTDQLDILFEDFSNGTMVSVSDGSYYSDSNKAACAWLVESACRSQWILGSMMIPGNTDDHSAYRSELGGLLAISVIIKLLEGCSSPPRHLINGCETL